MARRWTSFDRFASFAPRPTVASRKAMAARETAARKKKGEALSPVVLDGRTIARTFWGKAWCDNLESYSDYASRLPRGRSYVRSGSVLHLALTDGKIDALVQGSSLYKVSVAISAVEPARWAAVRQACAGRIGSVIELLRGGVSSEVMSVIAKRDEGLFPAPKHMRLTCTCPDWANLCKHVAAVLYGVGARLDREPDLLFRLRSVDPTELVAAAAAAPVQRGASARGRRLDGDLSAVFGIDVADAPKRPTPARPSAKAAASAAKATAVKRTAVSPASAGRATAKRTNTKHAPAKRATAPTKASSKATRGAAKKRVKA